MCCSRGSRATRCAFSTRTTARSPSVTTLQMVMDHPDAYNRIVPVSYLERETRTLYALGPLDGREAVLLRNRRTELTEERTVEYVI